MQGFNMGREKHLIKGEGQNTGVLSESAIAKAMRTVRIRDAGKSWVVKKVASPKVWRFLHEGRALAKAVDLAIPNSLDVVVHDKSGKIAQVISPKEFGKIIGKTIGPSARLPRNEALLKASAAAFKAR
jgi:hypothetical protein